MTRPAGGPARARTILAIAGPFVVFAAALVAIVLLLRPAPVVELPVEAHSGEVDVVAWVFIQDARSDPERGVIEVSAFVTATVESGGTCTVTATRAGLEVSREFPARPDASTTTCGTMEVGEDLTSGSWVVSVTYRGPGGTAESEPVSVEVE